jgi:hypothetical protein
VCYRKPAALARSIGIELNAGRFPDRNRARFTNCISGNYIESQIICGKFDWIVWRTTPACIKRRDNLLSCPFDDDLNGVLVTA